jgi:uncharacterized protein (DUF2237 family)
MHRCAFRYSILAGETAMGEPSGQPPKQLNVLGLPIELCCQDPVTGFFRDGHCHTGPHGSWPAHGLRTDDDEFLAYSVSAGNDLVTPMPQYGFPGLKEGDRWCPVRDALASGSRSGQSTETLLASDPSKNA